MISCKPIEISKDIYDRATAKGGKYIAREDMSKLFTQAELCGYGIYCPTVYEKDGKYWCSYYMGDSCD